MKTVVCSDVHLDVSEAGLERRTAFCAFLRNLGPDVDRLILLGDLFDFWFEYKHVIFSGYFEVLRALAELRDRGVQLHLICGNHDFWAGRFLAEDLNIAVYPDSALMDFAGKRVLFIHGDGVNKRDWGYRIYKRIARARLVVWAFGLIHPDCAMGIARGVSRGSRKMNETRDPAKSAEALALREFAQDRIRRGEADVVICGHAHAPAYEELPTPSGMGLYINCGDWMKRRSHVEWNGTEFRLRQERQVA